MSTPEILFEDKHLLVLNKPAGLACEEGRSSQVEHIQNWVLDYYKSSGQRAKNLIAGLCHRLDKPVSGTLLIAKKISVLKLLNEQQERNQIIKEYEAVVEGNAENISGKLQHYHFKDNKHFRALISDTPKSAYKQVRTEVKFLKNEGGLSFLQVNLHTGRYHQIRAVLAHLNHPIWNDVHYGARLHLDKTVIGLRASLLIFKHPVTGNTLEIRGLPFDLPF